MSRRLLFHNIDLNVMPENVEVILANSFRAEIYFVVALYEFDFPERGYLVSRPRVVSE